MNKRIIFHIDVNSAYLSWEAVYRLQQGANTDLRELPSVVGGDPGTRHGIVLAKSIPAKKYRIKTGDTLLEARGKCPDLVVVPPNYELYMRCSAAMLKILQDFSPCIQRYSVDECFLDYTNLDKLLGEPVATASLIKNRIKKELGFTVNIGISSNKLLAKMAGELKKPDAVSTIYPQEVKEKMWPLPVQNLFMVGRATLKKLHHYGIYTIKDLAQTNPGFLKFQLKSHGVVIWNYANGYENSPVRENTGLLIKGIGNSTTLAFDADNFREVQMVLLSLVETVSNRLRQGNSCTQLVSVSYKTNEFFHCSHQRKLYSPTDCTNAIYQTASELFDEFWHGQPVRHLGVQVSELCANDFIQGTIFDRDLEKQQKLDQAVDNIRKKYGAKSIFRSSFLHSGIKPLAGGVVQEEDYPIMSSIL